MILPYTDVQMRLIAVALLLAATTVAQEPKPKQFLIRIEPVRATFVNDMTPDEQKTMGVHFHYLKKLAAAGKVVLAGPSINGGRTFGIIVVEVQDEAEARQILEGDPSFKAGLQKGEVLPFHIAVERGR